MRTIHLLGSILDICFREHSDLDLLVDSPSKSNLLTAIALAKAAGPVLGNLGR